MIDLLLFSVSNAYSFEIPGIFSIQYQGETAFTDANQSVLLIATAIDMGGTTAGLGKDLPIDQVMQNVGTKINNTHPDRIVKIPLKGIYELYYGNQVVYMDGSARYFFRNAKLMTATGKDLTRSALSTAASLTASKNHKWLAQIAEEDMLVYPAPRERGYITIFTDVDCPFCRRIHRDIDTYTKAGITVKYLFYPRAGRQSLAYQQFVQAWCSENRYKAISDVLEKGLTSQHIQTDVTTSGEVCDNPVERHLQLAEHFGLMGTPAIILQDGTLTLGYQQPKDLIALALTHLK